MNIKLSRYKTNSIQGQRRSNTYYPNASDNLFSNYLNSLYNNSPTHQCIIDDIAQQIIGGGLVSNDEGKTQKLQQFFKKKNLSGIVTNLLIQESIALEIRRNPMMEIQAIENINVSHFRVTEMEMGKPTRFSYRDDWNPSSSIYNYKNTYINSYNNEELSSLLYYYDSGTFNTPYGRPKYLSAADAIELEIAIYMMHNHGAQNGMFPSMVISKETSGDPETDRRDAQETQRQTTGAANAGKVVSTYYRQGGNAPTFSSPSLSGLDKIYENQYETAEIGILKGHRIPSANLISGLNSKGSGFTSETEELAFATERMMEKIIIPRREQLLEILEPILSELDIDDAYFKDTKNPISTEIIDAEPELSEVNDSVKNLTGRQMQGIERIVRKFSKGQLTEAQAKLMLQSGYGFSEAESSIWLQTEDIDAIDGETEELSNVEQINKENLKKKDFDDKKVLDALEGEKVDLDEWELVDVREANGESIEDWANSLITPKKSSLEHLAGFVKSKPNGFSYLDKSFYKIRYSYQEKYSSGNSREFCKSMMTRTKSGVVYRLEDIDKATRDGVNKSFGHGGNSYDLFKYKGGKYCGHYWQEELYRMKDKTEKYISKGEEVSNVPSSYKPNPRGNTESKIAPKDMKDRGAYPS
jgi:hypothetical protein